MLACAAGLAAVAAVAFRTLPAERAVVVDPLLVEAPVGDDGRE